MLLVVPVVGLVLVGVRLASNGSEDGSITLTGTPPTRSAPPVAAGTGRTSEDGVTSRRPAAVPGTPRSARPTASPPVAAASTRVSSSAEPSTSTRTSSLTSTRTSTRTASLTSTKTSTRTSTASATATSAARTSTSPAAPVADGSFADQVVALTNTERRSAGCGPLSIDSTLTSVAQAHSADMARRQFFDHVNPDGASPFDRISAAGYRYRMAAENIAAGYRTPQQVVDGWMNSSGHRKNILNCGLTEIGVGYLTGGSYGTYWTQNFGTPAS